MTVRLDFLELLDAWVRKDGAQAGFAGEIAVGLRGAFGTRWWLARLGGVAQCEFVADLPDRVDACLLLGEAEARSLLDEGALPDDVSCFYLYGDEELVKKFLHRYLKRTNSIGIRSAT
jgi:hypothetical protein